MQVSLINTDAQIVSKFLYEKSWILISCIISLPGICSAAVTSSTWAATLASVETSIATATSELEGLDALANGLTGKMMDHYCA